MNVISDKYSHLSILTMTSFSDPFNKSFSTDESIREIMTLDELPWDNIHHRSSFLPDLDKLKIIFHRYLQLIMSRNLKILCPFFIRILRQI